MQFRTVSKMSATLLSSASRCESSKIGVNGSDDIASRKTADNFLDPVWNLKKKIVLKTSSNIKSFVLTL